MYAGKCKTGAPKARRGFATMSPERQRAIASQGGRAAHQQGGAHEWSTDEAKSSRQKRRTSVRKKKITSDRDELRGLI